ncbi:MAG: type II secretion system GspH family protein [Rickettsiales bacterium]|nr:type II secretion system GspH family protein [Rickettsiales bacterium]
MRGFSLLELSVVIVVIGLLTGGVVASQSISESAKLRRVIEDVDVYKKAVIAFKDQYEAYPGDFARATEIWGIAGGTGNDSTCYTTDASATANPKATCNGNGDNIIEAPIPGAAGGYSNIWFAAERYRGWQHLANSGMISGRYNGIATGGGAGYHTAGVNAPRGPAEGFYQLGGFMYARTGGGDWFYEDPLYNWISFNSASQGLIPDFDALTFYKIDAKIDDGKPGTGKVFATQSTASWQPNCTTTTNPFTAEYNVTSKQKLCLALYFKLL